MTTVTTDSRRACAPCATLSHLTDDELADQAEATLATPPPEKVAEARRTCRGR